MKDENHKCGCHSCTNTVPFSDEWFCFGCEQPAYCSCGCGCGGAPVSKPQVVVVVPKKFAWAAPYFKKSFDDFEVEYTTDLTESYDGFKVSSDPELTWKEVDNLG